MTTWIAMIASALALTTGCGSSSHHQPAPPPAPTSPSMPAANDSDPPAPPPDAATDATIATIRYQIDGAEVSQEAFETLRATLEIDEVFSEGERMDGFVQSRKARVRGSHTTYQLSLDVSPAATVHSLTKCPPRGC